MKRIVITISIAASLVACSEPNVEKRGTGLYMSEGMNTDIQILTIDSCEYIFVPYGNASWGSHKGNCAFCAKRTTRISE